MSGRRYFIVGLNAAGEVLTGTAIGEVIVDAGVGCMGPDGCPSDRVCDLGQGRQQTCPFTMANTGPGGYQCFAPMPPPMSPVCVRAEVVGRLQMDGGL